MSYNKTTWSTGDIVTAERLNNIENGIYDVSNTLIIRSTVAREGSMVINHLFASFNDIKNAFLSGKNILLNIGQDSPTPPAWYLEELGISESEYNYYEFVPFYVKRISGIDAANQHTISFIYEFDGQDHIELDRVIDDPDSDIVVVRYDINDTPAE